MTSPRRTRQQLSGRDASGRPVDPERLAVNEAIARKVLNEEGELSRIPRAGREHDVGGGALAFGVGLRVVPRRREGSRHDRHRANRVPCHVTR